MIKKVQVSDKVRVIKLPPNESSRRWVRDKPMEAPRIGDIGVAVEVLVPDRCFLIEFENPNGKTRWFGQLNADEIEKVPS